MRAHGSLLPGASLDDQPVGSELPAARKNVGETVRNGLSGESDVPEACRNIKLTETEQLLALRKQWMGGKNINLTVRNVLRGGRTS